MNRIYIYEGSYARGNEGERLVLKALYQYAQELDIEIEEEPHVIKDEKGKPYFEGSNLQLSISHSGPMWMCLISPMLCGIDIQEHREMDFVKLANRFFLSEEAEYVKSEGKTGFFQLWSMKEAFVKTTGQGLFTQMPSMVRENKILQEVTWKNRDYRLVETDLGSSISCYQCYLFGEAIANSEECSKLRAEIRLL